MIICLGRQHDDWRAAKALIVTCGERNEYFFPADAGHHIIEQDEIWIKLARLAQTFASVRSACELVTRALKAYATKAAQLRVIIHDKYKAFLV